MRDVFTMGARPVISQLIHFGCNHFKTKSLLNEFQASEVVEYRIPTVAGETKLTKLITKIF